MTICMAAIAKEDGEETIVFSTDHMVTTQTGQFEHGIIKYKQLNKHIVAMLAGNPLIFNDLIDLTALKGKDDFESIKMEIFGNFKKKRKEILQNELFDIYGIDHNFIIDSLKSPIPNEHVSRILAETAGFKLNTGILLIGMDEGAAKIVEITEANIADFREINFHAIGSGQTQAINTLLFQKHNKSDNLLTTIYNVYKAKRNAEVIQGVGKETELLVLKKEGCIKIEKQYMEILDTIYENELKFGKNNSELSKINLKGCPKCS